MGLRVGVHLLRLGVTGRARPRTRRLWGQRRALPNPGFRQATTCRGGRPIGPQDRAAVPDLTGGPDDSSVAGHVHERAVANRREDGPEDGSAGRQFGGSAITDSKPPVTGRANPRCQ